MAMFIALAINVIWQIYLLFNIFSNREPIFTQCEPVKVYSYGFLANAIAMLIFTATYIISFVVNTMMYDFLLTIATLFSGIWISYGCVALFIDKFSCKTDTYPFLSILIILTVNSVIGAILMSIGSKYSRGQRLKSYISSTNPVSTRIPSIPRVPPPPPIPTQPSPIVPQFPRNPPKIVVHPPVQSGRIFGRGNEYESYDPYNGQYARNDNGNYNYNHNRNNNDNGGENDNIYDTDRHFDNRNGWDRMESMEL